MEFRWPDETRVIIGQDNAGLKQPVPPKLSCNPFRVICVGSNFLPCRNCDSVLADKQQAEESTCRIPGIAEDRRDRRRPGALRLSAPGELFLFAQIGISAQSCGRRLAEIKFLFPEESDL